MEQSKKRRKESLLEKTAALLDLPADAAAGLPRLELLGDRDLLLEHYKGILSCEKEEIHVDAGKWVLRIRGRELIIRTMREHELRITGWVDSLEIM